MTFDSLFTVSLCISVMRVSQQSIAGVTYRDDFDFEERYRNAYECDPLYWHPLHLPSECAKMYEKIIRSKMADHNSIKIVKPKNNDPYGINKYGALITELLENTSGLNIDDEYRKLLYGYDNTDNYRQESFNHHQIRSERLPFEFMLDALREDVIRHPSQPQIEMMPNLGMVAVYRQPISSKSEDIIKKIALGYGRAGAESYVEAGLFTPSTNTSKGNKPQMYQANGEYHEEEKGGPSRTHYQLQLYPGLEKKTGKVPLQKFIQSDKIAPLQRIIQSDNMKKVKESKKGKNNIRKQKIVKNNQIIFIKSKKMR